MSIRQAKDKQGNPVKNKWIIVVEKSRDYVTGRRRQHKETFSGTEKQAIRRELEIEQEVSQESSDGVTVEYLAREMFLTWCKKYKNVADITLNGYSKILERYVIPEIGHIRVNKITEGHIEACFSGLSYEYSRKVFAVIRAMLRYAKRKHLVNGSPWESVEFPRKRGAKKQKGIYTAEEIPEIFSLIKEQMPWWCDAWVYGIFAGLRPEEFTMQNEPPENWDGIVDVEKAYAWDGGNFKASETKTIASAGSTLPLVGEPYDFVMSHSSYRDDMPLCVSPVTFKRANRNSVRDAYKRWCEMNGVKYIPPSAWRSTFATLANRSESSQTVANLLRHADKGQTADTFYIKKDIERERQIALNINRIVFGSSHQKVTKSRKSHTF